MSKILANELANYGDNAPIDLKEGLNIPAGKPLQVAGSSGTSGQVLSTTGTTVQWVAAFDGDYNSLLNKPSIPAAQVNADWNATSGIARILNKPVVPLTPSVTNAPASGGGSLSYNTGNGEFTYTPPDLSSVDTDTLATVTARGASTLTTIQANGGINIPYASSIIFKNNSGNDALGIFQPGSAPLNGNPSAYITYSGTADLNIQGPVRFTTIPASGQSSYTKADFTGQVRFNYVTYNSSFTRYTIDSSGTNIYGNLNVLDSVGASNVSIAGGLTVNSGAVIKFGGITRIETTALGVDYSNHQHNFAGDVTIANDKKLTLGSNGDLELYHNETQQNNNIVSPRDLRISVPSGTTFTSGNVTIVDSLTAGGLTYPTSNGTAGQVLTSDGAGNVVWGAASAGGGGIELTDLSVTTNAAGSAALTYNNVSGVFTYTPPDLSSYAQTASLTIANWDTAYGWGNHATAGYASAASLANSSNWDTAYSWGNHATAGYLTAESQTLDDVLTQGASTTQDITTTGRVYYSNQFPLLTDLQAVSASTYHGMFAHAHDTGHGYVAHAGGWIQLLDTGSSLGELSDVDLVTNAPVSGQVLKYNGSSWVPDTDNGGGGGAASVTISDIAPGSPTAGDLWWESDRGRLKIYYQDTDSSQWVDASPPLAPATAPVAVGFITLNGTSPTWTGTTGYTVSGAQPGGAGTDYEITLTFPTAYSARTDYIVQATYDGTNYIGANGAEIGVARGTSSVVFTPRRLDSNPLSLGDIMVTITNL